MKQSSLLTSKRPALAALLSAVLALTSANIAVAAGYPNPGRDSSNQSFVAGAYIIDSGAQTSPTAKQTVNQGLKPYGLVYALLKAKVEVDWIINPSKTQPLDPAMGNTQTDFTYDCDASGTAYASKAYKTGAFVIPKEFAAQAKPIIDSWKSANAGLVVDGPCTAPLDNLPVFSKIESWPRTILDAQNGAVATTYYTNAGIPQGSLTDASNPPAYRYAAPSQLTPCDDLYVMPHADPTYSTHQALIPFIQGGGSFYASCHAVSVIENMTNGSNSTKVMNFLSTTGLINYDAHSQGSVPYGFYKPTSDSTAYKALTTTNVVRDLDVVNSSDPIAQFIGTTQAATQAGSEQIFIPATGSYWRSSTQIIQYDPSQTDASATRGPAATLLYGPAYGNPSYGYVMYQGGHSVAKGSVDDVAAQRAFFNMVMLTAVDRRPAGSTEKSRSPIVSVLEPAANTSITGGSSVPVKGAATGGSGSYNYTWSAACYDQSGNAVTGGSFAAATAANTTFTAPSVTGKVNCNMTLTVVDTCGRFAFGVQSVVFSPDANLKITKSVASGTASVGGLVTYTISVKNQGKIDNQADGSTNTATNTVVTDNLPAGLTITAVDQPTFTGTAPTGANCSYLGSLVTCDLKDLLDEQTATITIMASVDQGQGGNTIVNTAQVKSDSADSDPSDNASPVSITVLNTGIDITVTASHPTIANSPYYAAGATGSQVTYTYRVKNPGNANLSSVVVKDNMGTPSNSSDDVTLSSPTGDTGTAGTLSSGGAEVWVFTQTRTVNSSTADDDIDNLSTTKRIEATATAVDTSSVAVTAMDDATVSPATPALTVTKTADSTKVKSGGIAYFSLTVRNSSVVPVDLSNVVVTDSFNFGGALTCKSAGADVAFTSDSATPPTYSYTVPTISHDSAWTARCAVTGVTSNGNNTLSANAPNPFNGSLPRINPAANSVVAITMATPDLSISKTATKSEVKVGDTFVYKIGVTNTTNANQTNVKIWDVMPSGLTVGNITRTRASTSGGATGTTGIVAWDRFYGADNAGGSGWVAGGNWTTTSATNSSQSFSSKSSKFTFTSSSLASPTISRTVSLSSDYNDAKIRIECSVTTGSSVVVKLDSTVLTGNQACGASATQVAYSIPSSFLGTATTRTLYIQAVGKNYTSSSNRTSDGTVVVDDIFITSGQVVADTFTNSAGSSSWVNNWTTNANTSSKITVSTSGIYAQASSSSAYSGGFKRTFNIPADTFSSTKLSLSCKTESLEANDYLEIWVGGVMKFAANSTSNTCATYSSSSTPAARINIDLGSTLTGDQVIEVRVANSNDRIYLEDLFVFGATSGAISSSDSGLTTAALLTDSSLSPAGTGYTLVPGEKITFEITVTVSNPDSSATSFVNTAYATSTQQPETSTSVASVETAIIKAGFILTKTAAKPTVVSGSSTTYTYVIENIGDFRLVNLTLVDGNLSSSAGDDINVGALTPTYAGGNSDTNFEPGETWTFTVSSGSLTADVNGVVTLDGDAEAYVDTDGDDIPDAWVSATSDPVTASAAVSVIAPGLTVATTSTNSTQGSPLSSKIYSGGKVTYTYTLTNSGSTTLESVSVAADNCPTPSYSSGDINRDNKMQTTETWIFTCTTGAITSTQSNQAVKASSNDAELKTRVDSNTQLASVTVFAPANVTLIRSVTDATSGHTSATAIEAGSSNVVTYTYRVKNSGTSSVTVADLASVVVDDKCSSITYASGDSGTAKTLEPYAAASEEWVFTCVVGSALAQTTVSNATASVIDPVGNIAQSASVSNTVTILSPSLLLRIEANKEYVKFGESVSFTYSIENNGGTTITGLTPVDNRCSPLSRIADAPGDNDSSLEIGETWQYSCTRTNVIEDKISTFSVSSVVDNLGTTGYSPAEALTQVFVVDPSMTVAQKASVYANGVLTAGPALEVDASVGDTIKYTYEIASLNTTHGSSISGLNTLLINSITDARCAPISAVDANNDGFNDGDTNADGQLDRGETWVYECSTTTPTQSVQVVDAQATVSGASVIESFSLRPASVRVNVGGAVITTPRSGGTTIITGPGLAPDVEALPGTYSKKLTLKVYFTGDSAKLIAATKAKIAAFVKKMKASGGKPSITVIGKVKETVDKSYDIRLSTQRALNVAKEMKRLKALGVYKTVAAGISPENKAISRRVEITAIWPKVPTK